MKCGTCGRETLPDGDCYGCECDRLRVTSRRVAQILIDAVGSDGPMDAEDVARRAVARIAELEAENERLREVLESADNALLEAEAILGGEYGDHYAPLCSLIDKLRDNLAELAKG
jgi:hypothetical protein